MGLDGLKGKTVDGGLKELVVFHTWRERERTPGRAKL